MSAATLCGFAGSVGWRLVVGVPLLLGGSACTGESSANPSLAATRLAQADRPSRTVEVPAGPGMILLQIDRIAEKGAVFLEIRTRLHLDQPDGAMGVDYEYMWEFVDPSSSQILQLAVQDRVMYELFPSRASAWGEVFLAEHPEALLECARVEGAGEEETWFGGRG